MVIIRDILSDCSNEGDIELCDDDNEMESNEPASNFETMYTMIQFINFYVNAYQFRNSCTNTWWLVVVPFHHQDPLLKLNHANVMEVP
ncbi:unnamed protein product [Lupinus luteus]|uniref:Uncharacterized protein n=1 Tax=Lupinus luteus TaxID=3873 RepID=A0AAV1X0M6_LUPLU